MIDGIPVLVVLALLIIGAAISGAAVFGAVVWLLVKLFEKTGMPCVYCQGFGTNCCARSREGAKPPHEGTSGVRAECFCGRVRYL